MSKDFLYIDGVTIHVARKVAKFTFGAFFHSVVKNKEIIGYDVYVWPETEIEEEKVKVDYDLIEQYKAFWGPSYRVLLFKSQEVVSR